MRLWPSRLCLSGVDEIPDLMCQFLLDREQITGHAKAYAPRLREAHKAENTLLQMGLQET